jgi:hypothetical protein
MTWKQTRSDIEAIANRLNVLRLLMVKEGLLRSEWYGEKYGDTELNVDQEGIYWSFTGYAEGCGDEATDVPEEVIDMPESGYGNWIIRERARRAEEQRKREELQRAQAERAQAEWEVKEYREYLRLKAKFEEANE